MKAEKQENIDISSIKEDVDNDDNTNTKEKKTNSEFQLRRRGRPKRDDVYDQQLNVKRGEKKTLCLSDYMINPDFENNKEDMNINTRQLCVKRRRRKGIPRRAAF
ncbi:hypothetical protein ACFE04_010435 [Oxalis oulophora]